MGLMDDLLEDINMSARAFDNVFGLKSGEKARIRFIADGQSCMRILLHKRYIKGSPDLGFTIPCPVRVVAPNGKIYSVGYPDKHICPYCEICPPEETVLNYCFLIWNYSANLEQAFVFKKSQATPLQQLSDSNEINGNITRRDYLISKSGEGFKTIHTLQAADATNFTNPGKVKYRNTEKDIHDRIRELMAKAWAPELLLPGEISLRPGLVNATKPSSIDTNFGNDGFFPEQNENEQHDEELPEIEEEDEFGKLEADLGVV